MVLAQPKNLSLEQESSREHPEFHLRTRLSKNLLVSMRKNTRAPFFSFYSCLSEICIKICIIMPNFTTQSQTKTISTTHSFQKELALINYTNKLNFQTQTKYSTINHLYQNQHFSHFISNNTTLLMNNKSCKPKIELVIMSPHIHIL